MSDPEKARHYLEALDVARCNGRWQEVPELVRKISKHAANRQCLCLTAQIEQRIATRNPHRPHTSSSSPSTNLYQAVAPLEAAIEKEEEFPEDQFQARVCLTWLHSVLSEPSEVLSTLSAHDLLQAIGSFTNIVSPTARWTHLCIVKGAYLRGISIETENTKEAVRFYESTFEYLSKTQSTVGNTPESNIWTERLLTRHISLAGRQIKSNKQNTNAILKSKMFQPAKLLGSFRLWSEYRSERQSGTFFSAAWVWKAYYDCLSILLQQQINKPLFSSKAQQYSEMQRAQTTYEAILMKEVHFPRAEQSTTEIDSWVDQVMANWRAFLLPPWQVTDLGQGGRLVLGKNVLEILYRSATRSYHSTRILRHLFTVHAQLGEFKLAGKALDTYIQVVSKGKARFEKSGELDPGFDDDATTLCTVAEGIRMLCVYGNRAEIEKSLQVAEVLQSWMSRLSPKSPGHGETSTNIEVSAEDNPGDLVDKQTKPKSMVPGRALAIAYRAIGISQRSWSRLTFDENSRSGLLTKAVTNFRAALRPEFGSQDDIDVLFSLAYTFCEQRDIDSGITTIKEAISVGSTALDSVEGARQKGYPMYGRNTRHGTRGTLLKCWHLMALLLSARQNFEKAAASCEAAEEMYGGKQVLHGDTPLGLSISESKGLIELKLTQLALSEVIEGPEEAVNSSSELLSLYTKLFKHPEKEIPVISESNPAISKRDTGSTHRSIRGSILGFPKDRRSRLAIGNNGNNSAGSLTPSNEMNATPAIAITSDDTVLPQDLSHHNHFLGRHESNKLKKRHSRKSLQGSQRRSRTTSPLRPATSDGGHHYLTKRGRSSADGPSDTLSPNAYQEYAADEVGLAISHDLPSSPPTPAIEQANPITANPSASPLPSHLTDPVDKFTPLTLLEPQYPLQLEKRQGLTLLVKIWLRISRLYRQAGLTSDAEGAIRESRTHVKTIETAIATYEGSSAANFSLPGYGGLSSLSEIWGDVLAETGALHTTLGEFAKASEAFETALRWDLNHAGATVGLSAILLDSYEKNTAIANLDTKKDIPTGPGKAKSSLLSRETPTLASITTLPAPPTKSFKDEAQGKPPKQSDLMSLSARDRAFKLLSGLTKSGCGWDNSEAWFMLARAYELSGQVGKAKDALWWVVELEDGSGVRGWNVANVA